MKEILDYVIKEIPRFIINYSNILTSPNRYILKITAYETEDESLKKSLIYFIICLCASTFFVIPIYGSSTFKDFSLFANTIFQCLVLLLVSVAAIKFSWKVVGSVLTYPNYLIIYSYQIGTLLSFYLFLNLVNLSVLRYLDPTIYNTYLQYTYKENNKLDPYKYILQNRGMMIFSILNIASTIFACYWLIKGWGAYRIKNVMSKKQALFAGMIFIFFILMILFLYVQINKLI